MQIKSIILKTSKAFTLIELAIVITILGLLVASVTAGTALVSQAKIRAVISEMQEMKSRISTFESVHSYKPGDFPDSVKLWGDDGICGGTASKGAFGNGDGLVAFSVKAGTSSSDAVVESYLAWCHLHQQGLGQSMAPLADVSAAPVLGVNIPHSKLKAGGYILANDAFGFATLQHALILGAPKADMKSPGPALTPKQAYAIDKKLDDGNPSNGLIRAKTGSGVSGASCTTSSGDQYNLAQRGSNVDCTIAMLVN